MKELRENIGRILFSLGIVFILLCIFAGVSFITQSESLITTGISVALVGSIFGFVISGIGVIIDELREIKNKLN